MSMLHRSKDLAEPELHVLGQIVGATEIDVSNVFCTYELIFGKTWECVGGEVEGQSQVDYPTVGILTIYTIYLSYFFKILCVLDLHITLCSPWKQYERLSLRIDRVLWLSLGYSLFCICVCVFSFIFLPFCIGIPRF